MTAQTDKKTKEKPVDLVYPLLDAAKSGAAFYVE
jgi:hypothetical protein